jgi:hypothetical protein
VTTAEQLPSDELAGIDLQPLAELGVALAAFNPRLGVTPERTDDDLGSLTIVALEVEGTRYLLRSFDDAPSAVTEIHCADAGHPVEQLRALLRACDMRDVLTHWWDGSTWHDEPLDPAA